MLEDDDNDQESIQQELILNDQDQERLKNRVKLYVLNDEKNWIDRGTGFVFLSETTPPKLSMQSETNQQILFEIEINNSFFFHIQHETILMWKSAETEDEKSEGDSAISFQDKEGLHKLYKTINSILGKEEDDEDLIREEFSLANLVDVSLVNLPFIARKIGPEIEQDNISNILCKIKESQGEFIKKLGILLEEEERIFEEKISAISKETKCTDNPDNQTDNPITQRRHLTLIFTIFKNLFYIADSELIELLMSDQFYYITFGALENDFESQKIIKHRQYFKEIVKFKNFLDIKSEDILNKIHMTHRLNYLKDTAIVRFIEDSTTRLINSMIQLNYNDIMQFFLGENNLIKEIIMKMKDNDLSIRKEACLFMLEMINCYKDIYQERIHFNEVICENDILPVIQLLIKSTGLTIQSQLSEGHITFYNENPSSNIHEEEINSAIIQILISIMTCVPHILSNYITQLNNNANDNKESLLMTLTYLLLSENNFGMKVEIELIFKLLLELENPNNKTEFFDLMFNQCFPLFIKYLLIPFNPKLKNELNGTKQIILEILGNSLIFKKSEVRYWFIHNNILSQVINLLKDNQKILNLQIIKFLKIIVKNKDYNVNKEVISSECFTHVFHLFNANLKKDNIIFSAIIDLFNSLTEGNKQILNQLFEDYREFFYCQTNKKYFKQLIDKYENYPSKENENENKMNNLTDDLSFHGLYSREMNAREDDELFEDNDEDLLGRKTHSQDSFDNIFNDEYKTNEDELIKDLLKKKDLEEDFDL